MYVNITTISVTAFCLANQKGFEAFSICQSFYVFTTHSPYMGNRKIKSAKFEREAVFYRVRNVSTIFYPSTTVYAAKRH